MRQILINLIYQSCDILSQKMINNGYRSFVDPIPNEFNQQGLYIIFDPQIIRTHGIGNKIIRIGKNGRRNNRLARHRQGNINDSILRKHVGRALNILNNVQTAEVQISNYIQTLNYLFLPVNDENMLNSIEITLIQIISNSQFQQNPIDQPGENWLGYIVGQNINNNIHQAHLWNVHHVNEYNPQLVPQYQETIQTLSNLVIALP
jgi:hypothetical protein